VQGQHFVVEQLRGERHGSRLGKRLRKTREHREVGVKLNLRQPAHPERS
jgi:hypothetical protein